jgi:hypothetical protein
LPVPTVPIDPTYGSLAYMDVQQWMVDPLWQNPPSSSCVGRITYAPDDGSCDTSSSELAQDNQAANNDSSMGWYSVPYEEARAAPPPGAPPLPSGVLMGAMNAGSVAVPVWVGPMSTSPATGPNPPNFAHWAYWANQLQANCHLNGNVPFQP